MMLEREPKYWTKTGLGATFPSQIPHGLTRVGSFLFQAPDFRMSIAFWGVARFRPSVLIRATCTLRKITITGEMILTVEN